MKQFSKLSMYALTAALAGFMMSACGDETTDPSTCVADADCGDGNICHPTAKQCVQSCTAGSDCPDSAKTCAPFGSSSGTGGGSGSPSFCQCSTDQLCGGGTGSSVICSDSFKICTTKCSDNSGCPSNHTCDTATGDCKAGVATPTCSTANQTEANVSNAKFGDCSYGEYCSTAATPNACVAAVESTDCPGASGFKPAWNKAGLAPVIYAASAVRINNASTTTECATGDGVKVTLSVYAPNGFTTHSSSSAADFALHAHIRRTAGAANEGDFTNVATVPRTTFTAGNKHYGILEFVTACDAPAGSLAVYLNDESATNDSNTVCVSY